MFFLHLKKRKSPDSIFSTSYCTVSLLPLPAKLAVFKSSPHSLTMALFRFCPTTTPKPLCQAHQWLGKSNSHFQNPSHLTHQQQFRTNLSILHYTLSSLDFQKYHTILSPKAFTGISSKPLADFSFPYCPPIFITVPRAQSLILFYFHILFPDKYIQFHSFIYYVHANGWKICISTQTSFMIELQIDIYNWVSLFGCLRDTAKQICPKLYSDFPFQTSSYHLFHTELISYISEIHIPSTVPYIWQMLINVC